MTSSAGGSSWATGTLLVVDPGSPLAANLPGTFAPASGTSVLQSVADPYLPPGADEVAVRSGSVTANVVYTVPGGDVRADGSVAPAHRVVMGYSEETLTELTDDGGVLFDNAVEWAAGTVPTAAWAAAYPGLAAAAAAPAAATPYEQVTSCEGRTVPPVGVKATKKAEWVLNSLKAPDAGHGQYWTRNTVTPPAGAPTDTWAFQPDPGYPGLTPPANQGWVVHKGAAVKLPKGASDSSFTFPGWKDGNVNATVEQFRSAVQAKNFDYLSPNDPCDGETTNPAAPPSRALAVAQLNRPFQAVAWARPDPTTFTQPETVLPQAEASLNIVQMGVTAVGWQWKMSMYKNGMPFCTFRGKLVTDVGSADNVAVGVATGSMSSLSNGKVREKLGYTLSNKDPLQYRVACLRKTDGTFWTRVWPILDKDAITAPSVYVEFQATGMNDKAVIGGQSYTDITAVPGLRGLRVPVGKRQDSGGVDADDAFGGLIDDVSIWTDVPYLGH